MSENDSNNLKSLDKLDHLSSTDSQKDPKVGCIALVGRTNAGKSTLLNALVGADLSIVSPKEQTTRVQVTGIVTGKDYQLKIIDTPGLFASEKHGLNEYMKAQIDQSIFNKASKKLDRPIDMVWFVVDYQVLHSESLFETERQLLKKLTQRQIPVGLVINKADRLTAHQMQQLEQLPERYGCAFVWQQSVSAVHKTSLELLIEQTKSYLPHEPWMYDSEMISDMPTRFFVQEKVRQQLYLQLNDELPYVCAVYVDQFQQATEKKKTHIQVSIWVEKDSQKPMVIGRKGIKIKDIGVKARSQIEQFLGETIFLGLFVKVKKNWTKSKTDLQYLGLGC